MYGEKLKRIILLGLGWFFVALGAIGIFVPLLPTLPFWILSAYLFKLSSSYWHEWLLKQPIIGPSLDEWEKHKVISLKAKILSTLALTITLSFPIFSGQISGVLKVCALSVASGLLLFIWTRNSKPNKEEV